MFSAAHFCPMCSTQMLLAQCGLCGGDGKLLYDRETLRPVPPKFRPVCPTCHGTGGDWACPSGHYKEPIRVNAEGKK
jgi:DnaJ-class molecular chaperone